MTLTNNWFTVDMIFRARRSNVCYILLIKERSQTELGNHPMFEYQCVCFGRLCARAFVCATTINLYYIAICQRQSRIFQNNA